MKNGIEERARAIDYQSAVVALAKQLATANPAGVELLALELNTSSSGTLQYAAATQLRVVSELPERLEELVATIADTRLEIGLRLGLHAVLRGVLRHAEVVSSVACEAAGLLEPALVFHFLLAELEPWLGPGAPEAEPRAVLTVVSLGVRDFMFPLLVSRVESSWRRFHRLRALAPEEVELEGPLCELADPQLARLLCTPTALAAPIPRVPQLGAPWAEADAPMPRSRPEKGSLELAGG